jgi:hypothetical protein
MQVYYHIITVETFGASKIYDGAPLVNGEYSVSHSKNNSSIRVEVEVTGSRTNVGVSSNAFNVTVYNQAGKDVTDCYKIVKNYGRLEISCKDLVIAAGNASKKYDGTELTCNSWSFEDGTTCVDGHIIDATIVGSQTNIGISDNVITDVKITDKSGKDVTLNYAIVLRNGELFVSP